ncbi:TetR/AcrR family transcriptional regulator [Actinocrispum wychmicini]|uniref:TetR family transcriptional regulator n=1 Tax=Actinocrispum wychmicini TaxID=1213861 RepID=A0A4R2IZ53_9PSEU|nr:TetR/AcrR family transcriptional regulator [Actinocrispum wychmicini]TCO49786.1 TetR family transcriptional regulator [Actinocrispum wychmicini]
MPPVNQQRREALADAAIAIVSREGTHGLSHRAVDEAAEVPRGTTSNYFRSREALLEATVARLVQLHFQWIAELRAQRAGDLNRAALHEILSTVLAEAVTTYQDRYRAMLELLLEGTRRPELRDALVRIFSGAFELVQEAHRADGVAPTEEEVHLMRVCYMGVLFGYVVLPETLIQLGPRETTGELLTAVLGYKAKV